MSQTFTYEFTDQSGNTYDIDVTADTETSEINGGSVVGEGYAVTNVTGSLDGTTATDGTAITGMAGESGVVQYSQSGSTIFNNAIFPDASSGGQYEGSNGSSYGIDIYGLEFNSGGEEYNLYEENGTFKLVDDADPGDQQTLTLVSTDAPCFCAGTRIRTPNGETNVEALRTGDLVLMAEGKATPVRWIGVRAVNLLFADPLRALPIRIKLGALGDGLPLRDLLVSPDHAMYIDGVLVQAGAMVNGISIVRESDMPATFTYYHIETPEHSLILAEGAPTETFIDNVGRMAFDNWVEHNAVQGIAEPLAEMPYARAKSTRQLPGAIKNRLEAVAMEFIPAISKVA